MHNQQCRTSGCTPKPEPQGLLRFGFQCMETPVPIDLHSQEGESLGPKSELQSVTVVVFCRLNGSLFATRPQKAPKPKHLRISFQLEHPSSLNAEARYSQKERRKVGSAASLAWSTQVAITEFGLRCPKPFIRIPGP